MLDNREGHHREIQRGKSFEYIAADVMKHFNHFLHFFFCLALIITVIMTLVIFFNDIYTIFITGNISTGTIHALGALLILWTLSELLNSEIRHLHGESIKVSLFVEVAIAAMVRKLLIFSTEGISLQDGAIYLTSLLVLGIVYWLIEPRKTVKNNTI